MQAKDQGHTPYGQGIDIQGSERFRRGVVNDLKQIDHTQTGHGLISSLNASGHKTTIKEGRDPETIDRGRGNPEITRGHPGTAKDAEIRYEPSSKLQTMGPRPWERNLPTSVFLEHEMVHADHITHGVVTPGIDRRTHTPNEELTTVGLKKNPFDPAFTENAYRAEMHLPTRTSYD